MRRRAFISLVGGAAASAVAWPLAARAQQAAVPVIGYLGAASPTLGRSRALQQGLKEAGYVVGENVAIEYRWAEGEYDKLPALALELVRRQVSVVVTGGNAAAFAAKAATTTIPIVFILTEDPVHLGLVASVPKPGGNATGINVVSGELTAKRLELLHELVPAAGRVSVLVNPADPTAMETTLRDLEPATRAIGLKIQVLKITTSQEIHAAFAAMVGERSEALFLGSDPFFTSRRVQLATLSARHGIPLASQAREIAEAGGVDELRSQYRGRLSSGGCLYRPHSQRFKACGSARNPVEQVRVGHQCRDRQGARPQRAGQAARRPDEVIE